MKRPWDILICKECCNPDIVEMVSRNVNTRAIECVAAYFCNTCNAVCETSIIELDYSKCQWSSEYQDTLDDFRQLAKRIQDECRLD